MKYEIWWNWNYLPNQKTCHQVSGSLKPNTRSNVHVSGMITAWRVDCIMYGETILDMIKSDILDMIKSDRNSSNSRLTDNLQNFWRVDCVMYGDTTRGDCRNCRNIFRQLAGAGFGGPLLLSTKNCNDITDQYYWSAQPDVPSAVRGALVVCFSVCSPSFLCL